METDKKRIEFIDLAKGICIILVVISHCHINIPYLQYIRMPLYFVLSGLFFKEYAGFWDFTIRKTNKILIPFLFFYLVGFLAYFILCQIAPDIRINTVVERFYILDPIYSRLCVNSPLWFLLSLFTINILFYIINKISTNVWVQFGMVAIMTIAGSICKSEEITLYCYFEKTLFYAPFFFMGNMLKKSGVLVGDKTNQTRYKDLLIALLGIVLFLVLALINIRSELMGAMRFYAAAIVGVMTLLLTLKAYGKSVPIISYFGRYSIVVLCTSFWIYNPLRFIAEKANVHGGGNWIVFIVTMIVEYFVIKVFVKYLPYVTAQKDLIPVKK